MRHVSVVTIAFLMGLLVAFAGCAPADTPRVTDAERDQTRETINAARHLQAEELPRAQIYLRYAVEQASQAERALERGDDRRANLLLARAQADADLALALASEQRVAQQVTRLEKRIERLREQSDL
jgi:hypothetical protein